MKPLGRFELQGIEEKILSWWEKEKLYEDIKKAEPKDRVWRFIDGPPYTTGDVHIGTAWNKILKDLLIRYKRMQGFRVTDTPGYDTHGLPIEVVIEQKLGIKNKQEILEFGLDKFIAECRHFAESKIGDMNNQFKRLGCTFWNWENPYITLTNTYVQGIWWTLKKAYERGLLYKFFKPQNCCPRCATALAKHEFEYANVKDNAIYVKFRSVEDPKKFYLIWTTTPWTLVSNTNIMVNPNLEYVEMQVKGEIWVMGLAATANLMQQKLGLTRGAKDGFEYGRRFNGIELEGKRYIHPLAEEVPEQAKLEKIQSKVHTILLSEEFVQEGEGVGLVHTAPGHGPEDFEVGVRNGIPVFSPVDMRGCYTEEAGKYVGKYVHDVNQEIMDLLKTKGTLIAIDDIEHEYAHCWRCKTKLVYRATEQWFFKTSSLIPEMLKENEQILWVPDYAGNVNFKLWITNLQDWCISRQRYWGIPLSIWTCDNEKCDHIEVIGSAAELKEKAGKCPDDLHKPWIDTVTWACNKCKKGTLRRIPDVLDVWLDSGSVMWASQFFVDGKEHYDSWVPADFIIEGKDQIRGWFNSLLCSAMVSSGHRNYNACYMHGWVMSHGTKMSKSLGNAIHPSEIIEGEIEILTEEQKEKMRLEAARAESSKFDKAKESKQKKKTTERKRKLIKDDPKWSNIKGIETFRFFSVLATPPGKDLNFDYKEYVDTFKVLNTFWNSFVFAEEKIRLNNCNANKLAFKFEELSPADKWILSRINNLVKQVTAFLDKYELPSVPQKLQDFILNDLSRWYITIIRENLEPTNEDPEKLRNMGVLWYVLYRLLLLMAPINPMLTEEIYLTMFKDETNKKAKKSIHLESWPKADEKYIDEKLEKEMISARNIIDAVRGLKTDSKIKLRWSTKGLYIIPKEKMADKLFFEDLIEQMSNVKELIITAKIPKLKESKQVEIQECTLILNLEDTKDLQEERILKDLLRTLQFLRKENSFKTGESITLSLATENPFIKGALENNREMITNKVTATNLEIALGKLKQKDGFIYHEFHLCLNGTCFASVREKAAQKIKEGKAEPETCAYCDSTITKEKLGLIQLQFKRN
jgi:isoleucyl-tRNA synthetase